MPQNKVSQPKCEVKMPHKKPLKNSCIYIYVYTYIIYTYFICVNNSCFICAEVIYI